MDWLKKIWTKFKKYIVAVVGAIIGVLCVVLGFKDRKINKLGEQKAAEEQKRREAEKAAEKAKIDAETAARIAAGSEAIDAETKGKIAEISGSATVPAEKYNEGVGEWNAKSKTSTDNNP